MKVKINKQQRRFILDHGSFYTCLGFDVLERRASSLAAELLASRG